MRVYRTRWQPGRCPITRLLGGKYLRTDNVSDGEFKSAAASFGWHSATSSRLTGTRGALLRPGSPARLPAPGDTSPALSASFPMPIKTACRASPPGLDVWSADWKHPRTRRFSSMCAYPWTHLNQVSCQHFHRSFLLHVGLLPRSDSGSGHSIEQAKTRCQYQRCLLEDERCSSLRRHQRWFTVQATLLTSG